MDIQNLTKQALLQTTVAQENALQDELDQYDSLLNDESALQKLRARRLKELQQAASQQQQFRAAGHGVYSELVSSQDTRDVASEFFAATKASERLVVHFYRPQTLYCDVFHKHLERLAQKHLETRFYRINVQDCDSSAAGKGASFLVERLGIVVMPTLILIHKRQTVHQVRGFDELGSTDDFSTATLARLLVRHKVLFSKPDDDSDERDHDDEEGGFIQGSGINKIRVSRGMNRRDTDDGEEY